MLCSPNERTSEMFAFDQCSVILARTACALERYRIAHGEYPQTLNELAPQFIAKVSCDLVNGQPLHYRLTPDGQFILYSIGWKQRDAGGTVIYEGTTKTWPDRDKSDWVWRYPPK